MDGRSFDPDYAALMGIRLRNLRNARDWSLAEVGRISRGEFAAPTLASYERGDRQIPVYRLAALARFYGVPVAALLPGAEDPGPGRSDAAEFAAEMSLIQDSLGRYVLAASGPRLTVTVLTTEWAEAEAFAGLYADLRREEKDAAA